MCAFRQGLLIVLLLLPGCQNQSGPVVAIDNWWTVDYARNSCKAANACGLDPQDPGKVQEYIDSLKAKFASATICQGVSVFDLRGPAFHDPVVPDKNEMLIIDYIPNRATQSFSIMGKPSNGIRGAGTIDEIVSRSCAAARGLGAKVQ
jgi:hypothetical protein